MKPSSPPSADIDGLPWLVTVDVEGPASDGTEWTKGVVGDDLAFLGSEG